MRSYLLLQCQRNGELPRLRSVLPYLKDLSDENQSHVTFETLKPGAEAALLEAGLDLDEAVRPALLMVLGTVTVATCDTKLRPASEAK